MKIFLSWSKEHSRSYAEAFRDWLPHLIQSVEPFISSHDIALGSRGVEAIEEKLSTISFGILFVSEQNKSEPWLLYEAGAPSRSIDQAEARVIPLLIDVDRSSLSGSPISHFQNAQSVDKSSIKSVCQAINENSREALGLERFDAAFEKWWPDLEDSFEKIKLPKATRKKVTLESLALEISNLGKAIVELRNNERAQSDQITQLSESLSHVLRAIPQGSFKNSRNYLRHMGHRNPEESAAKIAPTAVNALASILSTEDVEKTLEALLNKSERLGGDD